MRIFLAFPVLVASSLIVVSPAQAQSAPPSSGAGTKLGTMQVAPPPGLLLFNRAIEATNAKNYALAERLYRQLLKDEPTAAAAWANLGLIVGRNGTKTGVAEAIRCLKKATELEPVTGAFWGQLSAFYLRAADWKAAESAAKKALSREPNSLLALSNLADALMQQKRYTDAIVPMRRLRSLPNGDSQGNVEASLIVALSGAGQKQEAVALARKRVARRPKDVNALLLLGDAARIAGNAPEAKRAYEAALRLDPKSVPATNGAALAAAVGGDREAALRVLDAQLDKTPEDPRLQFQKGILFFGDPRFTEADRGKRSEPFFKKAAALNPKNASYVTYYALSVMTQGEERFTEANGILRAALNVDPRYTLARLALANLAERQQKGDEARAQYEGILSYKPDDRDTIRGLAGLSYSEGNKAEAYRRMNQLADLDPQDIRFLGELASWQVSDKALPEAQKTYTKLLLRDPKNTGAHLSLGQIYESLQKADAARKEYETALADDPKNGDAALILGRLLTIQKQPEAAAAVYRRLLAVNPTDNRVRWQLASNLQEQKRFDEALTQLNRITLQKNDPNRSVYLLGAPRLLLAQKRAGEAIPLLTTLVQQNPDLNEARYALADAYEQANRFVDAERVLLDLRDKAARDAARQANQDLTKPSAPNVPGAPSPGTKVVEDARPLRALAGLYERADKLEEAAISYEDALRLDPQNKEAMFALNALRQKQNKPQAATEYLHTIALADPTTPNLPAIGAARQLHVANQTLGQYVTWTKEVLAKYPENRIAQYIRGRAVTEEKPTEVDRKEAVGLYERILEKNPNDSEVRLQAAQQYEALGRKEDAIKSYRALLNLNNQNTEALAGLRRLGATPANAPATVRK